MKRMMLVVVAGAALLVGCASDTPPEKGFGTEAIRLTDNRQSWSDDAANLYLLVAGDECQLSVKLERGVAVDYWLPLGEVDCAAALALFGAAR